MSRPYSHIRLRLQRVDFSLEVDLRLPGAGITVVFGPSGCGKTSLLRCVAGLEPLPDARVFIAGETWQDAEAGICLPTWRRPLGYVFQEASLFEHLDVRGNLEFGLKRSGLGRDVGRGASGLPGCDHNGKIQILQGARYRLTLRVGGAVGQYMDDGLAYTQPVGNNRVVLAKLLQGTGCDFAAPNPTLQTLHQGFGRALQKYPPAYDDGHLGTQIRDIVNDMGRQNYHHVFADFH